MYIYIDYAIVPAKQTKKLYAGKYKIGQGIICFTCEAASILEADKILFKETGLIAVEEPLLTVTKPEWNREIKNGLC